MWLVQRMHRPAAPKMDYGLCLTLAEVALHMPCRLQLQWCVRPASVFLFGPDACSVAILASTAKEPMRDTATKRTMPRPAIHSNLFKR